MRQFLRMIETGIQFALVVAIVAFFTGLGLLGSYKFLTFLFG